MKRIVVLAAFLLLASCGGSSSEIACSQDYWDGTVGTCLPDGWEILDTETLRQRGVPEETIVAFQAKDPISGQFPTVAVTQEQLSSVVDPLQYSDANIRSIEVVEGYTRVDIKDYQIAGTKVSLHIFTAQPIEGEPRRRFYQVSTTDGDMGYTITAVTPVSIDKTTEDAMLLILSGIVFEQPKEK